MVSQVAPIPLPSGSGWAMVGRYLTDVNYPPPSPQIPPAGFARGPGGKVSFGGGGSPLTDQGATVDDKLSMDEIESERAVSLPNKEVLSLLDVNANVDLGLYLAAPVDLAVAANLNVAAPIEASAAANV